MTTEANQYVVVQGQSTVFVSRERSGKDEWNVTGGNLSRSSTLGFDAAVALAERIAAGLEEVRSLMHLVQLVNERVEGELNAEVP